MGEFCKSAQGDKESRGCGPGFRGAFPWARRRRGPGAPSGLRGTTSMSRLPALTPDQLSLEQKRLHDAIAGPRGGSVGGPFAVWLRVPRIAEAANRMGNSLRLEGKLERRLFELAILVIARHWSAQYEWFVHEKAALDAGLAR